MYIYMCTVICRFHRSSRDGGSSFIGPCTIPKQISQQISQQISHDALPLQDPKCLIDLILESNMRFPGIL